MMNITKSELKNLIYEVNGAAIEVNKALGPGLLESVYHLCMKKELSLRNVNFVSEKKINIIYKGEKLNSELRCDLFIEKILPVELKAVEKVLPVHEAQIISYMNLLNVPEGLLINFNVNNLFKQGQKTYVNKLYRQLKP